MAGLTLNPSFAFCPTRAAWTAMSDDKTYLTRLEPYLEGLRKAGVPDRPCSNASWEKSRLNR
jgi:hypothetical protein